MTQADDVQARNTKRIIFVIALTSTSQDGAKWLSPALFRPWEIGYLEFLCRPEHAFIQRLNRR
jgi:hypothetical protein